MAKKEKQPQAVRLPPIIPVSVNSKREAIEALTMMEEIQEIIQPYMDMQVDLKKAATQFCTEKKIDKVPVGDHHYSLVTRHTRSWNPVKLRKIIKEKYGKVKPGGKPLWNYITKRVVDPELINRAVAEGHMKEKVISKAFEETPQTPFLQRYSGRVE